MSPFILPSPPLQTRNVLPRTHMPTPTSTPKFLTTISFQPWYPPAANSFSLAIRQSDPFHCFSSRWSERAVLRNAPSNVCLMVIPAFFRAQLFT